MFFGHFDSIARSFVPPHRPQLRISNRRLAAVLGAAELQQRFFNGRGVQRKVDEVLQKQSDFADAAGATVDAWLMCRQWDCASQVAIEILMDNAQRRWDVAVAHASKGETLKELRDNFRHVLLDGQGAMKQSCMQVCFSRRGSGVGVVCAAGELMASRPHM